MSSNYRSGSMVVLALGLGVMTLAGTAARSAPAPVAATPPAGEWLVLPPVGRGGRSPVRQDPLELRLTAGDWQAPAAGERVSLPDGSSRQWEAASPGKDGTLRHNALRGGYACLVVDSPVRRVALLDAAGHSLVYANGEPRTGDPYGNGTVLLPVLLRPGKNVFLFSCGRGELRAALRNPTAEEMLDARDGTLPDIVRGGPAAEWAALVVENASERTAEHLRLRCGGTGVATRITELPPIPPLGVRKVAFRLDGRAPAAGDKTDRNLVLERLDGGRVTTLDRTRVTLRVRKPGESYRRTFLSTIDGSVQYYAVRPALQPAGEHTAPALFLTLHGASVEALGQVDAYASKSWGTLVAPTNRRPYGFDWEDWGRLDALEVLDLAQRELKTDPRRVYLTGHSMGGHGTWILGATYPDRWAAIGPSAGWVSFWSYAGGPRLGSEDPIAELLQRATNPSDTLSLSRNYASEGVYILHGTADDNVPVEQARSMKERLSAFQHDFQYYEEPGAGHWWDRSPEPGADCVDWPPMFDLFAHHMRPVPEALRQLRFTTASPGVSSRLGWAEILQQTRCLRFSTIDLQHDPGVHRIFGTTDNVARLALDLPPTESPRSYTVELDGQKLEGIPVPAAGGRLYLARQAEHWHAATTPPALEKSPLRCGPFKEAFRNHMVFVYGTHGSTDENAWALAKARYDAETFWYRGNGSVDVVPDRSFSAAKQKDRNVILYGNAETNSAWGPLLGTGPVQVRRGAVKIGDRETPGTDLACLFVRPRPGSDRALVAAVSGSGLTGMRLTDRAPYFVSGVGYPDVMVWGPEMLSRGLPGVRCAGYFGNDWSVSTGEFAWR